jgi:hypothetical protein
MGAKSTEPKPEPVPKRQPQQVQQGTQSVVWGLSVDTELAGETAATTPGNTIEWPTLPPLGYRAVALNALAVTPVAMAVPAQPQPPANAHSMRRSEQGDSEIGKLEPANVDQTKKSKKKNKIRSGIITGIVALGIAVLALAFMGIHHVRTRGRADFGEMQHHQKPAQPPNVVFVDRSANPLYQRASVSAVLGRSVPPGRVLQSCGSVASYASIAARQGFGEQQSVMSTQRIAASPTKFYKNGRPNTCQM